MFIYEYEGLWKYPAKCGVEIKKKNGFIKVILTELKDNPGTSVTNFIEKLATMIWNYLAGTPVCNIVWIEHYPADKKRKETFDRVFLSWDGKQFQHPEWKHIAER